MAAQTYCTRANVVSILSEAGVKAFLDDDESSVESSTETAFCTDAIERTAGDMNAILFGRYVPADLVGSVWCKWHNARRAAAAVCTRRLNPLPATLADELQRELDLLDRIASGDPSARVPDVIGSLNHLPTVSNFDVQRGRVRQPVRVAIQESTGPAPLGERMRPITVDPYP